MKKVLAVALACAALLSFGSAQAAPKEVKGTIIVPSVSADGVGTLSRHIRCAYTIAELAGEGAATNGYVGWVVKLDTDDPGRSFTLTSDSGEADFDVVYYLSLGTCDNDPAPVTASETFEGVGDEAGTIPADSKHAIILFKSVGHSEAFTYTVS